MLTDGQYVTGEVEAKNRSAAIEKLAQDGRTIFELSDAKEAKGFLQAPKLPFRGIPASTVAFTTRQLAETLDAGMPLVESLTAMAKFGTNKKMTEILESVITHLLKGKTFSDSLAKHPEVFSNMYIDMVRIGETTGQLSKMVEKVADYLERDLELRSKIRSALTYPTFVLVFCSILCWVMVAYLLPGFEPIWTQSGLDLRRYPLTEFLLAISRASHNIWDELLLVLMVGGVVAFVRSVLSTAEGARKAGRAAFRLPVFGHFIRLAVTARVANSLATLVESGVALDKSLELAAQASGVIVTREALEGTAKAVRQGQPLATSLEKSELFPPLLIQMVAMGEESGKLPQMLSRVGIYYRKQLDEGVKNLSALIEPVTMVVVGGIVGVFIMGVILPIMGIVSAIQTS